MVGLVPAAPAQATSGTVNSQINFQGRLLNSAGAVIPDGNYNIQFKIYKDGDGTLAGNTGGTGGTLLWTESRLNQASQGVTIKNGYFSVQLGSITALPSMNESVLWLSMNVAGGANATSVSCTPFTSCTPDGEMLPMRRLTAAVYALQAENANQLGGLTSGQYVQYGTGNLQADSSTNNSVYLNKTNATGNLITLQRGGSDAFTVDNDGDLLFGSNNNKLVSIAQSAASTVGRTLTLTGGQGGTGTGSAGGSVTLQGGAAGGTNADGGSVFVYGGAKAGTGNDGNVALAYNGSTALGNVGIRKAASSSFALDVSGNTNLAGTLTVVGPSSTNLVQVQNANNNGLFSIDATPNANNLIDSSGVCGATPTCGGFENGTGNWALVNGSGSAAMTTTTGQFVYGAKAMDATFAGTGDKVKLPITLSNNAYYSLNFYVKSDLAASNVLRAGYAQNGSTEDVAGLSFGTADQAVTNTGWIHYQVPISTGTVGGSPYIYFKQNSGTTRHIYIDNIELETVTATTTQSVPAYRPSQFMINGSIASPLVVAPVSNSSALQVLDGSNGAVVFNVDNRTDVVGIGTLSAGSKFQVLTSASNTTPNYSTIRGGVASLDSSDGGTNTLNLLTLYNSTTGNPFTTSSDVLTVSNNGNVSIAPLTLTSAASGAGANAGTALSVVGANGQGAASGNNLGGNGSAISLTAGSGGASTGTSANSNGGTITLQGGAAGTGGSGSAGTAGGVLVKNVGDSATAFRVQNAAATSTALDVDTTNGRVGIGTATPGRQLHVSVNNSTVNALPVLVEQAGTGDAGIEYKTGSKNFYAGIDNTDGNFKISSPAVANGTSVSGNSSNPGTSPSADVNANGIQALQFTAGSSGTINSVSMYITSLDSTPANRLIQAAIYTNKTSGCAVGNPCPDARLAISAPQTAVVGWNTISISGPSVSSGSIYWVAMAENGSNFFAFTGGGLTAYHASTAGYPAPDPFAQDSANTTTSPYFYVGITANGTADYFANAALFQISDTGATTFRNASDSTGAFQVQNAAGTAYMQVDSYNSTVNLGVTGSTSAASTINIATSSASGVAQVVTVGSNAANTSSVTVIQGGSNTTGAIQLLPNTAGGIMVGATAGTGTITVGQSTASNTISIGSANPGASSTQTINIGNGVQTTASSAINVNILSGSAGSNGTATLSLANNDRVTQVDIGNVLADAARTLNVFTGNSAAVDTINIGTGNSTVAGGKTVNIANGSPTGSGSNTVSIGSTAGSSTTTLQGGTGNINLVTNAATAGVLIKTNTNSSMALSLQNASSFQVFSANTTGNTNNLVTNGGFENNVALTWAQVNGTATATRTTSSHYAQSAAMQVAISSTTQWAGIKYPITLSNSTTYSFSFYAKLSSSTALVPAIDVGYSSTGALSGELDCDTAQPIVTTGWTRYACTFTTPSTNSGTPYLYIEQDNTNATTFLVDNVLLTQQSSQNQGYYDGAVDMSGAVVNGPFTVQNTTDGTAALQVYGGANVYGNLTVYSTSMDKAYRFRTSGGSLDLETSGVGVPGELWMTGWTGQNFTGTQVNFLRMSQADRLVIVGNASGSSTPTLLVVDKKTDDTTDPTNPIDGAIYYNNVSEQFRCFRDGKWDACSTNPIDRGFAFEDEFLGGSSNSGTVGNQNWDAEPTGSPAIDYNTNMAPTANHPGIIDLYTGSTSGNGVTLIPDWDVTAGSTIIGPSHDTKSSTAFTGTLTNLVYRTGLDSEKNSSTRPLSGVWWEAAPTVNARWQFCYGDGTTATCSTATNTTPTVTASTWYRTQIHVNTVGNGTSSVDFYINGTKFSVTGVTIDSTNRVNPSISCYTSTASQRNCSIDYFQYSGVSSAAR